MKKYLLSLIICLIISKANAQTGCSFLCNSDFELNPGGTGVHLVNQNLIPCWNTTATDGIIEYWYTGTLGTPAYSGNYLIELNAYQVSTLYQNFTPVPGSTVQISFAHRGRAGVDVMSVSIGPVGGPYTTLGTFTDGNTAWGYYTVSYTFPTSISSSYSLRFNSVSAAGGNPAIGNFLDAITVNFPQASLNSAIVQPSCNLANGSISLNPSGGLPPYTINWQSPLTSNSPTLNNLSAGSYGVQVTDSNGCQVSGNFVLVNQGQNIQVSINETICQGTSYNFYGTPHSQSGNYQHTLPAGNGCDTLVTLHLQVSQNSTTTSNVNTCDSYTWPANNQSYTQSGTYTLNQHTIFGCDSVINLNLNLNLGSSYLQTVNADACQQYTWPVSGQTYFQSGLFSQNLVSVHGCDSIIQLNLSINPNFSTNLSPTICPNDSYNLLGNTYSAAGVYHIPFTSVSGCDSSITLNLQVFQSTETTTTIHTCDTYTWAANNQTYTQSGIHIENLTSIQGCDSTATLNLEINASTLQTVNQSACNTYTWPVSGQTYSQSGQYTQNMVSAAGCDSVVQLNLSIHPNYTHSVSATICENQNYNLQGSVYNEEGDYQVILNSVFGCDSTIALSLIVEKDTEEIITSVCDSQTYMFNNVEYPAGVYQIPYITVNGCPVLANLQIIQTNSYNSILFDTICSGQSIKIGTESFHESGTYEIVLETASGCDSNIVLNLYIRPNASDIFYPNVFTPNDDNINDLYGMVGPIQEISSYEFYLYNRWGNLIYKTKDPLFKWDGEFMHKSVSQGVYFFVSFYKIKCTGDLIHEAKGSVTVLK